MSAVVPTWRFDAIGTRWEIETAEPLDAAIRSQVTACIDDFDRAWSRFRPDSLVTALAAGAGSVPAPPDTDALLSALVELSRATAGAVNPLVGDALAALGYDASYSFRPAVPRPAPEHWRSLLTWDAERLSLAEPATIDVGALGKGRLVDLVLAILTTAGHRDVVVDASGDLAVRGRSQRIGLEHPFDPSRAIGVWEVTDAALCASASNRRAWTSVTGEGLHHVLDARTGQPVRSIVATWAVAATAMRADAIATALFFDGGARLAHEGNAEWVRMLSDGRVEHSAGSKAELFT